VAEPVWSEEDAAGLAAASGASVRRDAASRSAAAEDFGHLVSAAPWAVVSPRSVEELAAIVAFAAGRRLPLCARGRGYSQSGQSLSAAGLSLDLSRLDRIGAIEAARGQAQCEPGVRWRELTAAALRHGLLPVVLPLNLDMSVGGLLSAGGIGANSQRHGLGVTQVTELDVVTGGGHVNRCTSAYDPDLYAAVLGGLGRCGIIARASVRLRRAPARVRTFHLVYGDSDTWLADQARLADNPGAQYLEAMCWMGAKGFRGVSGERRSRVQWLYGIQVGFEYDQEAPEQSESLRALSPWRVVHVDDEAVSEFVSRYQPRFDGMQRSGAWQQLHPWLECLLPVERMPALLPAILDDLPLSLGDGHRLIWVDTSKRPPFFAAPEGGRAVCFAVLPTGVSEGERGEVLAALGRLDGLLREAGGKRYLSGWLGPMDDARWREHLGGAHERWTALKRRFDPGTIFRSALFPAG
jgi:cytokinin dehydrogenase